MSSTNMADLERRGRGAAVPAAVPKAVVDSVEEATQKRMGKPKKLWDRKVEAMRSNGTTPRDLYERDPFAIDAPDDVKKHVGFLWMSDLFLKMSPMCHGFNRGIYEPVTPEVEKELGITVLSRDRTPDGVPRVGMDATLYWAPRELLNEQDKVLLSGAHVNARQKAEKRRHDRERLASALHSPDAVIGDAVSASSAEELAQAALEQRGELGTSFGG